MLACLTAKRLGAQYAIARIRDPEYLTSLSFLQKELSIDYAINPERATAREISRMLRFPFAGSIETFARGRVEMVDFRAMEGDAKLSGKAREARVAVHGAGDVDLTRLEYENLDKQVHGVGSVKTGKSRL